MTLKKRFDSHWILEPHSGCWIWSGRGTGKPDRYGTFSMNGKTRHAHRVAWELYRGEIPKDLCVLHHCDRPSCVNPEHLFLGTTKDNYSDSKSKGRNATGEKNGRAILTFEQVQFIRSSNAPHKTLAKQFGISLNYIWDIRNDRTWKDVFISSGAGCERYLPASERHTVPAEPGSPLSSATSQTRRGEADLRLDQIESASQWFDELPEHLKHSEFTPQELRKRVYGTFKDERGAEAEPYTHEENEARRKEANE